MINPLRHSRQSLNRLIVRGLSVPAWRCCAKATVAAGVALSLSGCINMPKTIRELAKDQATSTVSVQTVYGTVKVVRTNPGTNTTVSINPDGTVVINRH